MSWELARVYRTNGAVCSSTCSALFKKQVLPKLFKPLPIDICLGQVTAGSIGGKKPFGLLDVEVDDKVVGIGTDLSIEVDVAGEEIGREVVSKGVVII